MMLTALFIRGFLQFLLSASLDAFEIDTHCKNLSRLLETWEYKNEPVQKVTKYCEVSSTTAHTYFIDFEKILTKELATLNDPNRFYDLDFYFKCNSPQQRFEFKRPSFPYRQTWLTTVRVENCGITWDMISAISGSVYLHHVYFVMRGMQWHLNPSNKSCDDILIGNISNLQFRIEADVIENQVKLEDLLPNNCSLPNVASLAIHCFNTSDYKCSETAVTYDGIQLPHLFPNLQGLYLQGVHPTSSRSQAFPWADKAAKLPFNISRTLYEQEQYTNGIAFSTPSDEFRRLLSVNRMQSVEISSFCNINGMIARIDLHNANVSDIPSDCFTNVQGLVLLDLSYNSIEVLNNSIFQHLSNLIQLYLNNNKIAYCDQGLFNNLGNLRHLDLSNNQLTATWQYLFKDLSSLESCSLENNSISKIEFETFPLISTNLTFINLRNNQLQFLPKDCLRFPMLKKCDCDNNYITLNHGGTEFEMLVNHFDPSVTYLWDPLSYYGEALSFYTEGIAHESDQTEISLQNNNITEIPFDKIQTHMMKKQLAALLSFVQLNLGKTANLTCTAQLLEFREFLKNEARALLDNATLLHTKKFSPDNFQTWSCRTFHILGGNELPLMTADSDRFLNITDLNGKCPTENGCVCYSSYINASAETDNSTTSYFVDCSGKSLSEMPIDLPATRDSQLLVSLEGNQIASLPDCQSPGYHWLNHVTELDLHNNHFRNTDTLTTETFLNCLKRIRRLDLRNTNLQHIPASIQAIKFEKLKLSGNNIKCCGKFWLKTWLQQNAGTFTDVSSIYCSDTSSEHPIIELESKDFVCSQTLVFAIWITFVLSLLAISLGFIYAKREDLEIKLFSVLSLRLFDQQEDAIACKYDSYVMYCDDDFAWAQRTLLVGLECLGFKTYDKNRDSDFRDLDIQIEEALSSSRRVVVVLSPGFLKSNSCLSDFERAVDHSRGRKRSRFIVIVCLYPNNVSITLEPIDQHNALALYLSHGCFVSVYSKDFWKQLLFWLPKQHILPRSTDNITDDHEFQA